MIGRLRAAGVFWATMWALPALLVLIGLGTWQLQRKACKDNLQAAIDTRAKMPPVSVEKVLAKASAGKDVAYTHVTATGRFQHARELYYYAPRPRQPGWHVYTPIQLGDGRWVIVNRGFIPDALRDPAKRRQPQGKVSVTGLLRSPGRAGTFTPANDTKKNIWYWRDLDGMARTALGGQNGKVVPYFIDADAGPEGSDSWPRGGTTNTRLNNRHLEYALTWYGLALTLIGVWAAFVSGRLRSIPKQP